MGSIILTDSILLEVRILRPETLWVWDAPMYMPMEKVPDTAATLFVEVKLQDLKSIGPNGAIGYAAVHCRLFTEDMHDSTGDSALSPIHGVKGFYYGANIRVPSSADTVSNTHTGH
jgi:hypothetical protein